MAIEILWKIRMVVFSVKYNINEQNETVNDLVTYTVLMAVIKMYYEYSVV